MGGGRGGGGGGGGGGGDQIRQGRRIKSCLKNTVNACACEGKRKRLKPAAVPHDAV